MDIELPLLIERQPDHTTCGPTALQSIYRDCGDPIPLEDVIEQTPKLPGGGTLAKGKPLLTGTKYYRTSVYRLLGAIFLGVGFYDGNLMRICSKGIAQTADAMP